jgi:hypothetical protein
MNLSDRALAPGLSVHDRAVALWDLLRADLNPPADLKLTMATVEMVLEATAKAARHEGMLDVQALLSDADSIDTIRLLMESEEANAH